MKKNKDSTPKPTPSNTENNPKQANASNINANKKHRKSKNYYKNKNKTALSSPPPSPALALQEIRQRITTIFEQYPRKSFGLKTLFKQAGIHHEGDKLQAVNILETLLIAEEVKLDKDGHFKSNKSLQTYVGRVDFVNPRYAYIICEGLEEDVWVNTEDLQTALDGDIVRVLITGKTKNNHWEGEVLEIIERKRTQFVGRIDISRRFAFVVVDNKKMFFDIFIPKEQTKKAKNGEKVLVEITEWHTATSNPVGKVIEVLGKAGENNTEMHAILSEYGLPLRFAENLLTEAEQIKAHIPVAEIRKRRDFRPILTFTIDPEDAKDFDDALSLQYLPNGNYEVGIHIADVTYYVKPNSLIDKEAQKRGTSVYLVDRVIPMLPERLSNFLCSLRPHEDKLTFSSVFELTPDAEVVNEWFGRTIIHSNRRFSYEEAQQVIETGQGDFAQELVLLNNLAKKLTQERFRQGAMNFETTEVKFKLNEKAVPIGIYLKERKDAHRLIEEFMLLANKKVAEFIYKKHKPQGEENTMVYRIHEMPLQDKLDNFAKFAHKFGYHITTQGKAIARSINQMMAQIEGTPQYNALQSLAIRTMAKARYSTEPLPHFGLAFEHYTHFTSPIRRYPDMMVHELLANYLQKRPKKVDKQTYENLCKHATDMERRAAEAERASIKYKQVEYMQIVGEEGKIYDGVVTGLTEWGMYVEILETRCEGLVRLSDMVDMFDYDAEKYRIVGRHSGKVITFGDKVRVSIKATNLEKRTIDLYFEQ